MQKALHMYSIDSFRCARKVEKLFLNQTINQNNDRLRSFSWWLNVLQFMNRKISKLEKIPRKCKLHYILMDRLRWRLFILFFNRKYSCYTFLFTRYQEKILYRCESANTRFSSLRHLLPKNSTGVFQRTHELVMNHTC